MTFSKSRQKLSKAMLLNYLGCNYVKKHNLWWWRTVIMFLKDWKKSPVQLWCHFQLHCLKLSRRSGHCPSLNRFWCKQQHLHLVDVSFWGLLRSLEHAQSVGENSWAFWNIYSLILKQIFTYVWGFFCANNQHLRAVLAAWCFQWLRHIRVVLSLSVTLCFSIIFRASDKLHWKT